MSFLFTQISEMESGKRVGEQPQKGELGSERLKSVEGKISKQE